MDFRKETRVVLHVATLTLQDNDTVAAKYKRNHVQLKKKNHLYFPGVVAAAISSVMIFEGSPARVFRGWAAILKLDRCGQRGQSYFNLGSRKIVTPGIEFNCSNS